MWIKWREYSGRSLSKILDEFKFNFKGFEMRTQSFLEFSVLLFIQAKRLFFLQIIFITTKYQN